MLRGDTAVDDGVGGYLDAFDLALLLASEKGRFLDDFNTLLFLFALLLFQNVENDKGHREGKEDEKQSALGLAPSTKLVIPKVGHLFFFFK